MERPGDLSAVIRSMVCATLSVVGVFIFVGALRAQADEMCREFGETPTREVGRDNRLVPFVYGRIVLLGLSSSAKPPRVTVIYSDSLQPAKRQLIGKSGNYCFQKRGTSGTLLVDVDGMEVARKSVSDISSVRQREDFEVYPIGAQTVPPGVVSTKFSRPRNDKTADLYKKTGEAEKEKDLVSAVKYVNEIVTIDPGDFIAWAKLGSLYFEQNALTDAESAFKRSLELKPEYTPPLINLGTMRAVQKQFEAAIEIFKQAISIDPTSARTHRFLGEAYLQVRKGTLGIEALNESIRLDPGGMAECHLLIARLYDLAGAKNLAAAEYKTFLTKVPGYKDKKKLETYIHDNPK